MRSHSLGPRAIAAYAVGSFGTGIFSTVPSILLLYFCTEILRVPAQWATAIVFVPKVWSIAWDPFVGAWSDSISSRFGRRLPFLAVGAAGVALSFIAVFSPPKIPLVSVSLWVGVSYFMLATLYSVFAVPYIAIVAEIGDHQSARAQMVSWRMVLAMLGVLTGAGVVPLLVSAGGGGRAGYATMSLWVACACAMAMAGPVFMLRWLHPSHYPKLGTRSSPQWRSLWSALLEHRFSRIAAAYLLQLTAVAVISSSVPYLITKSFGRPEREIGTAMIVMFTTTMILIPAWSWAGRRFGNIVPLMAGATGFATATMGLGISAITHAPWVVALLLFVILGATFAAVQVLPFTILAHLIHAQCQHGRSAQGSFTGVWTATEKLGLALGPSLTGLTLSFSSVSATKSLAILNLTAPAILIAISLLLLRNFAPEKAENLLLQRSV